MSHGRIVLPLTMHMGVEPAHKRNRTEDELHTMNLKL